MKISLEVIRGAPQAVQKALSPVGGGWRSMWHRVLEPFTGAWQRNMEEKQGDLITYPTLYAVINRVVTDMGKFAFRLRERKGSVWTDTTNPAYSPVLRKPNAFQTQGQFREYWILTKLTQGNAYILKRRDARGVVIELYVLDPNRVMPMVSTSGNVYYKLMTDALNTLLEGTPQSELVVPASEIIHDRCMTPHHPLIGVPPLAAAHWPALKNMKIMRSATEFFANNAQPGGILSGPAGMDEADAEELRKYWEENFTGTNAGRVAVIGSDVKFTSFAMKSIDAQMVEQMRYSDEQICQPFGVPPFKVGIGSLPSGMGVDGINLLYYNDALQTHIEHMENLLDDGLRIADPQGVELDLSPLLRMDEAKRAEVESKLVGGKIKTPDEGRASFNLGPTGGGGTLWGQNQDYPLGMLADRQSWDQSMQPAPAPAAPPESATAALSAEDQAALAEAKAFITTQRAITAMRKAARMEA